MATLSPQFRCTSDSHTEKGTAHCGHAGTEQEHYTYRNGVLSWAASKLLDEDIITVTSVPGSNSTYTIFSLSPADVEAAQPFQLRVTNTTFLPDDFRDKYLFRSLPRYLQEDIDIHVLISTLSGTGLAPAFFDGILHPLLRGLGLEDSKYNVIKTESTETVKRFARETLLAQGNCGRQQTVVILSGDGGVVETINGLLDNTERAM
jgi:hypothetical protein